MRAFIFFSNIKINLVGSSMYFYVNGHKTLNVDIKMGDLKFNMVLKNKISYTYS